jgi:hypothetical protein
MTKVKKLTDAEKKQVYDYALPKAQMAYPDATVHVAVDDYLGENGHATWSIRATTTKVVPNA